MVLQSEKVTLQTIVDHNQALPFQLKIIIGSGWDKSSIIIDRLTSMPQNIMNNIYEIIELKNLKIELTYNDQEPIEITWGSIYDEHENESLYKFTLDQKTHEYYLFTNEGTGSNYPWRCGTYHFEVMYKNKTYFGGFKVVPKNIDEKQLSRIHELIEQQLEGLTYDYLKQKQTIGQLSDFEQNNQWQFIQWYQEIEHQLHTALTNIEKNSQDTLIKYYNIESEPKLLDNRSIRWQNTTKGQIFNGSKYLNRKLRLHWDTDENRLVKFRMSELIKKMDEVLTYLNDILNKYEKDNEQISNEVENLEKTYKLILNKSRVTESDKRRISQTLSLKKRELEDLTKQADRIKKVINKFNLSRKTLSIKMHSNFWNQVSIHFIKINIGKHWSYQICNRIWNKSNHLLSTQDEDKIKLPMYRPTSELYEYYVFFSVIHIFLELNFQPQKDTVTEQLYSTLFDNGLKDGTRVVLQRDNLKVNITYDEMVGHNASAALEQNMNFYSLGSKRKPDLRLDLYVLDDTNSWIFQSSFIIEIKYSPFYNIYSKDGQTRAMEQMSEYWRIAYVYTDENGEEKYKHQIVKNVICVYPDTKEQSNSVIDYTDAGTFLKFFPNVNNKDIHASIGKDELKNKFNDWFINHL